MPRLIAQSMPRAFYESLTVRSPVRNGLSFFVDVAG